MEKLELKHIAPYLPYGLKCFEEKTKIILEMEAEKNYWDTSNSIRINSVITNDNIKPILRPLSDLTKEIEHNGKKFIPIDVFSRPTKKELESILDANTNNDYDCLPHYVVNYLLEWHFNVFNLPKELWIDINTL